MIRTAALETRELRLRDGRRLAWAEYGDEHGTPVFYSHGTPSSHLEPAAFGIDRVALRHGLQMIAPDRPGMGGSDYQPHRRVVDWPTDLAALADYLALERFTLLGYSGGGPYVAAAAHQFPERVSRLALVACVAHLEPGLDEGLHPNGLLLKRLARERPFLARLLMTLGMRIPARYPSLLAKLMNAGLPEIDRRTFATPDIQQGFAAAIRCAFRQGARGPQLHEGLMSTVWGFDPAEIAVPVQLWQGTLDNFGARPAMAEHLHVAIADSELHLSPDGHVSILTNHLDAIVAPLCG